MGEEVFQIDSSVILEMLLGQERADECIQFFNEVIAKETPLRITVFSLYSVEIIMCANHLYAKLKEFLDKIETNSRLSLYATTRDDEREVIQLVQTSRLDFDDALQYYVAKKTGAHLVSYDKDFDRTDIRRVTPEEILTTL